MVRAIASCAEPVASPLFSAAILAGGRASRFGGRDKGSLVVEGLPILSRQLAELSQVAADVIIVGGNRPTAAGPAVRHLADRVPGRGPLGGVHTALEEAHGHATVVIACDMPYVAAPLLRHLLELTAGADLVVPRTERGYHPLCAAYTRGCIGPIARRLADGRLSMIDLVNDVQVRVVPYEELALFGNPDRLLANVNTPADYESIEANQP